MTATADDRCALFGTPEPLPDVVHLAAGPLTAELIGGAIRRLSWHGVEIVRGLECLVRDAEWRTCPHEEVEETTETGVGHFQYERRFTVMEGAITAAVAINGTSGGVLTASVRMRATRDVTINRAGFVVLHPAGVAGTALTVRHTDGHEEVTSFPQLVAPAQPVKDIAALAYAVACVGVSLRFGGEVFEMEDQRNWSDASFKTYSRPLALPRPYRLMTGEILEQTLEIACDGNAPGSAGGSAGRGVRITGAAHPYPEIALAVESGWLPDATRLPLVAAARVRRLQIRIDTADALALAGPLIAAMAAAVDLELPLSDAPDAARDEIARLAEACAAAGIRPEHVVAVPRAFMDSHQPEGPWPQGLSPVAAAGLLAPAFAEARIGGGMLTNFTEFNRHPPVAAACDYVTHATAAIVHAADDRSVMETIEALPHIFASGSALAGGCSYRLGLAAIGMRTNPYGAALAPNDEQVRRPMTHNDPRQRGLFAAAFAVGVLAAAHRARIETLALAAPVGPFGIVARREKWPQPLYDADPALLVFPLFHVIRAAARGAGKPPLAVAGLPMGVDGIGFVIDGGARLLIANLGDEPRRIDLPDEMLIRVLDIATFHAAASDADWLCHATPARGSSVELGPYASAFVDQIDP